MGSPFVVAVRSGPVKMATIECMRTESGVKLLSVTPQTGPVPYVADITGKEFADVNYIRAAIRRRWSRDRTRLAERIRLTDKTKAAWFAEAKITGAHFNGEDLMISIDDGNAVVELTLTDGDWTWANPTDKGLLHGA